MSTTRGKRRGAANGSLNNIAGICNRGRNVVGLMPHPERACEASLGSDDGRVVLASAGLALAHATAGGRG
jgi:phosphoribosylformylglycinamidine synthase